MLSELVDRELKGVKPELGQDILEALMTEWASAQNLPEEVRKAQEEASREVALSLFDLRLGRAVEGERVIGFDEGIFEMILRLRKLYADLLTGKLLYSKGKILCSVKQELFMHGKKLDVGELVNLELDEAFALITAGYLSPYSPPVASTNESA
jgi:hypothetical protein